MDLLCAFDSAARSALGDAEPARMIAWNRSPSAAPSISLVRKPQPYPWQIIMSFGAVTGTAAATGETPNPPNTSMALAEIAMIRAETAPI